MNEVAVTRFLRLQAERILLDRLSIAAQLARANMEGFFAEQGATEAFESALRAYNAKLLDVQRAEDEFIALAMASQL